MRKPSDFPKALIFMTSSSCVFYMVIAAVIYYYAGSNVASPALGSTSPAVKKVVWALALPTIIIAGVVNASVGCKYVYIRYWQGTDVIHQNSIESLGSWAFICATGWVLAWIIAEAIPNFNTMISFIVSPLRLDVFRSVVDYFAHKGALFGSWFSCTYCQLLVSTEVLS